MQFSSLPVLEHELVVLRPITAADIEPWFNYLTMREVYEFEGEPPPSLELLERGLRRREARLTPDGKTILDWAVRSRVAVWFILVHTVHAQSRFEPDSRTIRPHEPPASSLMRFEGTLTSWNDDRGFGRIESSQGGEPIFVHVSAWPRGTGRPQAGQAVTFEVESGPKGKRARNVQIVQVRRPARPSERAARAQWGTATLFAIPAFLVVYVVLAAVWKLPAWVAGLYLLLSAATFFAYAADKSAAARGSWRTPESTFHTLSVAG